MSRAFNRHVADTISFAILGGFTIAGIVALVACCNGCGGDPFTSSPSSKGSDPVDASPLVLDAGVSADDPRLVLEVDSGVSLESSIPETSTSIPDVISSPEACAPAPAAWASFPAACGTTATVETPSHFALVVRSSVDDSVLSCTANATPSKCSDLCGLNCECILSNAIFANPKSCSCAIVDQVLPVVTCQ